MNPSKTSQRSARWAVCIGLATLTLFGNLRADDQPNIILLMGDDHGWDETAYNGHPHLRTPVLDEMAAAGMRFDHFYSASPVCSPTRGSVITGHESRVVPLFPELRPYLDAMWEQPGATEFVINRYRDATESAFRRQITRIIKRAGLKPWPRIFHNLRASRQTELESEHPTHVVCAWIGNSPLVARKHYLQVTDDHFEKATEAACSALQNPVQLSAETPRNAPQANGASQKKPLFSRGCE